MQSELSAPLTRLDAMLWFLRVQLWVSGVALASSLSRDVVDSRVSILRDLVGYGIPVVALAIFPRVLANSALAHSARERVTSPSPPRTLVLRGVGLTLFVQTLGWTIIYSLLFVYNLLPFVSSGWSLGSGITRFYQLFAMANTASQFLLGFFLAFGPAIRDHFRKHRSEGTFL